MLWAVTGHSVGRKKRKDVRTSQKKEIHPIGRE